MSTVKIKADYYQQFDADHILDVPAEGYGGWKQAEIEISPEHTAVVMMHAWDTGEPDEFPGWRRCVEYIPRAEEICRTVFPPLLEAVRSSEMKLFHVVGGGNYYADYPGHKLAVELAGLAPALPDRAVADPTLNHLWEFRGEHVFVGRHNDDDVRRGFERLGFPPEAEPVGDEGIAENEHQLFALCRHFGVNHLIYAGFAINWCLLMSPGGMLDMSRRGFMCSAIRQAVTAVENKESARSQICKELALWRVALAFGFVFDVDEFTSAISRRVRSEGEGNLITKTRKEESTKRG